MLKIAIRQLNKQRLFSVINISGLAISLASFFLIISYVAFEMSYDRHIPNHENIYRIQVDSYHVDDESKQRYAVAYPSTGPWLVEQFPEVLSYTRMNMLAARGVFSLTDEAGEKKSFDESRVFYTSPEYLDMFSIQVVEGNTFSGLDGVGNAMLSKSTAEKFFGNESAIGKTIKRNGSREFIVSAVFQDDQINTHLKCDILLSYETLTSSTSSANESWGWWDFYTYVELDPNADLVALNQKIKDQLYKKFPKAHEEGRRRDLNFQPIASIHLNSNVGYEHEINGSQKQVDFLIYVAIFIVVIAFINYVNLSTAKSMERAKEVGVRKVMGSNKSRLIWQFMLESFVIIGLSLMLGLTLYQLGQPILEDLLGQKLMLNLYQEPIVILSIGVGFLLLTVVSGFYPAFILSGFSPLKVLSGRHKSDVRGVRLRRVLVFLQFGCTSLLIAATLIVHTQIDYMLNAELGLDIDQTVVFKGPKVYDGDEFPALTTNLKTNLMSVAGVSSVTASSDIPGKEVEWSTMYQSVNPGEGEKMVRNLGIDERFLTHYDIEVLAGRGFEAEDRSKSWWAVHRIDSAFKNVIMLNESAAKLLGFDSPENAVGKTVNTSYGEMVVVGVTKDFNYRTLRENSKELVMLYSHEFRWYYSIKIDMEGESLKSLQDKVQTFSNYYAEAFPGNPINYFFLDDYFNRQYQSEFTTRQLFSYFSLFALFIACLGMIGLSAYLIQQKRKEVGIRKVVGASAVKIFVLLIGNNLRLVIISYVFAVPITYLVMSRWLEDFAHHIEIGAAVLIAPVLVIALALIITVGYQTLKAALANPIESLRYE